MCILKIGINHIHKEPTHIIPKTLKPTNRPKLKPLIPSKNPLTPNHIHPNPNLPKPRPTQPNLC